MKKILFLLAFVFAVASAYAQTWVAPDEYSEYRYSTVVYARLNTNLTSSLVLGAFVNGECKAIAYPDPTGTTGTSMDSGSPVYTFYLRSDYDADLNMPISFRVFDTATGFEYILDSPSETKFVDQATYGQPSNAVVLTLTAATSFELHFTEAELWTPENPVEYNLKKYMTVTPEGGAFPINLEWSITPEGYAMAADSLLMATVFYDGDLTLNLMTPANPTGAPTILASSTFRIVQHATAIDLINTTFEVNKNDIQSMKDFMQMGVSYKIEPETSTDQVLWETENSKILSWDDTEKAFNPLAGGTTRMRPYILQNNKTTKLVPLVGNEEGWITVKVNVPVQRISIDYSVFDGSFKANVGDTHLYERMAKMITILPSDATVKTYNISIENGTGVVEKVGNTTFNAVGSGTATLKVEADADPGTVPVQATIDLTVEKPVKSANITNNTIYATLTDGNPTDITDKVKANVSLLGDPALWATQAKATLSGTNVTCTDESGAPSTPSFNTNGLVGIYTAVAEGTSTMTIDLSWPNYDDWGITSDELTYGKAQKKFDIVVQALVSLVGFDVAVTNPVVGANGTITLTPQPAGATFDPNAINVSIFNDFIDDIDDDNDWSDQLVTSVSSATTAGLIYNFKSTIPGNVNVKVTKNDVTGAPTAIPVNDPLATASNSFTGFEIGWPLELATGWQWRSNPCGFIASTTIGSTFGTTDLTEIRTGTKLLYNDPNWGLYGTLISTAGILQGQCYKVNMKNAHTSTLFGSTVTDANKRVGTSDATANGISITLNPGWNWVGNPYLFDRNLNSLFGGNEDFAGFMIVGKTGFATYNSTTGLWEGALKTLKAGEGFIIKNSKTAAYSLVFPAETTLTPANDPVPASVKGINATAKVWEYDHTRFMNNMAVIATLEDIEHPEMYSIGAFVGDECRGEGFIEDGKAFITVHCDANELVSFKLYSPYTNDFYFIEEVLKAQASVGSLKAPLKLHAGTTDGINAMTSTAAEANESYDLTGRRSITTQRGITLRRMSDGTVRKVIVK